MNDADNLMRRLLRIRSRMDSGPRAFQQDRCAHRASGKRSLFVIADGMGGHDDGEKAASTVVDAFVDAFVRSGSSERPLTDVLQAGLDAAEKNIKSDPAANRGATVVAALLEESNPPRLAYTWVGDSRLYLLAENNRRPNAPAIRAAADEYGGEALWLLTRDDSLIWDLYAGGKISLDDISRHPMKNRLRHSLFSRGGTLPRRIEETRLGPGDRLLLCTDGVWESFPSQQELLRCLNADAEESHRTLSAYLDAAVRSGLCTDNNSYFLADLPAAGALPVEQYSGEGAQ